MVNIKQDIREDEAIQEWNEMVDIAGYLVEEGQDLKEITSLLLEGSYSPKQVAIFFINEMGTLDNKVAQAFVERGYTPSKLGDLLLEVHGFFRFAQRRETDLKKAREAYTAYLFQRRMQTGAYCGQGGK